jgi:cyclopropane-fatty-acyl-phospholipid synthase
MTARQSRSEPSSEQRAQLWAAYRQDEEVQRTNSHYELGPEFFTAITGGEWNVYSCNLWDDAVSVTASQEAKLDMLADLMQLQPGMRVLDVGCGWGGPLCYLARSRGVTGVGISPSPSQIQHANERARSLGVDVRFAVADCMTFADEQGFDAVYSDEVVVHFDDLRGYFERMRALLRPGGILLTKEVHFASSTFMQANRLMVYINEIFGGTGHYLMLHDELRQLDEAGLAVQRIASIPARHYSRTAAGWSENLARSRESLEPLVGADTLDRFRTYLRLVQRLFNSDTMTVDVVTATVPRQR